MAKDKEKIKKAIEMFLEAIGEDIRRPDLVGTPQRIADMCDEIFYGLDKDPQKELEVIFTKEHDEIILVKDIPFYSICVGRRMCVYTENGVRFAEDIRKGDKLLTFNKEKGLSYTKVDGVFKRKVNEIYEIRIGEDMKIKVTGEHPLYIRSKGWVEAKDLKVGDKVIVLKNRRGIKRGKKPEIKKGYNSGYLIGALASDDSRWRNQVRLEANSKSFKFKRYEFRTVKGIKRRKSRKKYIVYNFSCTPYNTFIINGVWVHNCEHHLLPFFGKAHIAYIPDKNRITGLSKLARVVDVLSKKPQVQEKLTTEIAKIIMKKLKPKGVMVVIEAEHLCMSMRGIKKPGAITVTSAVRGIFRKNEKTRSETLSLIGPAKR